MKEKENIPYQRRVSEYNGEYDRGYRQCLFTGKYKADDEMRAHERAAYDLGWHAAKRGIEWREFKRKHLSKIL